MKKADVLWSINPFKLAENAASTERTIAVSQLERFVKSLANDNGSIQAVVTGLIDEDRRKLLKCRLTGEVNMTCQTSFKVLPVTIEREVTFCPVMSEEAIAAVPDEYEAFLYDTEELDLVNLIEDELILSLPLAVYSPDSPEQLRFGPEIVEQEEKKPNPFAVLAQLKQNSEE
ncbi:YceD family protein [Pleionea mediterranea]|jgi:uncharacterized protein|uniref:Large ribosomal RNA subunit accumulation protein YceD n=1 Tax=Pleionea mediterranea TaxID=523701 RepID=A0A316FMC8_9GAMM|nr:YceD family protein [Pleionea mediterranea]PWK49282.1 uncharacterized protein C8D97_108192 [Pleionea mediterranea]